MAHTPATLLIGDLESRKLAEVPWSGSGSEKFIFENPAVRACLHTRCTRTRVCAIC